MTKWFLLPTNAFWRKFCGVSDEYETLKNRWKTLGQEYGTVLHRLGSANTENDTFSLLDKLLGALCNWFDNIGFCRNEDSRKTTKQLIEDYGKLEIANQVFFDLCTYVGLIKHAFFQRTVSLEIPQLESAVPHSPERTTGNEMFYVVADRLASAYANCVSTPEISWDGFITFMPAVGEEGFYGAFFRPSKFLKLFHISMSEEQKYFLGTYLTLAHEFGHSAIVGCTTDIRPPAWYWILYAIAMRRSRDYISQHQKSQTCKHCELNNPQDCFQNQFLLITFEDFIADVFAARIAGVNTIHSLLDFAPGIDITVIRSNAILQYLIDRSFEQSLIDQLATRIRSIEKSLVVHRPRAIKSPRCIGCWAEVGRLWGSSVKRLIEIYGRDPISEAVLKEFDHDFRLTNKIVLEKAIVAGSSVTDVDPRTILSVYYELVNRNKKPNYSATTCSLLYNETR